VIYLVQYNHMVTCPKLRIVPAEPSVSRPRNVERTKATLLEAALAEFSEHGLAGARIDRIAERAGANKRLLYAYFGNKHEVFAAAVTACVAEFNAAVPFEVDDLPGYAGRVYDFLAAHDVTRRVLNWRDVEGARPTKLEVDLYRAKLVEVAGAQRDKTIDDALQPVDVIAVIEAVIESWLRATVGLRAAGGPDTRRRRAQHRAAIVEAVRRVVDR
jgi:AcrR family transcriptional regulator